MNTISNVLRVLKCFKNLIMKFLVCVVFHIYCTCLRTDQHTDVMKHVPLSGMFTASRTDVLEHVEDLGRAINSHLNISKTCRSNIPRPPLSRLLKTGFCFTIIFKQRLKVRARMKVLKKLYQIMLHINNVLFVLTLLNLN